MATILGYNSFNFQELFIKFSMEGKEVELRGIAGKRGKRISSNGMTKLIKKEQRGVTAQLCSLEYLLPLCSIFGTHQCAPLLNPFV